MADEFVTQNQHRADLAELHLEIANSLASLDKRSEILIHQNNNTALTIDKSISEVKIAIQSLEQKSQQNFSLLQGEIQRVEQRTQQDINNLRQELRGDINNLRQDTREARSTTARQMWTMITLVVTIVAGGVIKLVFFP